VGRALLLLLCAIAFEVLWAVMLKASHSFTLFWPSLVTVVAYLLSAVFLAGACQRLDISLAYAIWTGSGATGVALIGVLVFHERLGAGRAVGLSLVICGVVVLLALEGGQSARAREEQALHSAVWDSSIWRPGLDNDHQLLGVVYETMPHDPPALVPWYVRLLEDPRSPFALPGAADPFIHDCIRITLGRALANQDQAFVIGFTMGASGRCAAWQQSLFRFCARRLYRGALRFSPVDCQVFDFALEAGRRRGTVPLHRAAFHTLMHRPLGEVRSALGIEPSDLYLLYDVERVRWPRSQVSARLPRPASCFPEAQVTTEVYFHARTLTAS
jgi:multidrug transporter EmrE-like cation transporter